MNIPAMTPGRLAGILSLAAALVHGGLTSSHFEAWWGYGVFFLAVTSAQAILGLALVLDAFEAPRQIRALRLCGAAGNLAVALVYVASRTIGVPWFGPSAGAVEPVDLLGTLTLAGELIVAALLMLELRRSPRRSASAS